MEFLFCFLLRKSSFTNAVINQLSEDVISSNHILRWRGSSLWLQLVQWTGSFAWICFVSAFPPHPLMFLACTDEHVLRVAIKADAMPRPWASTASTIEQESSGWAWTARTSIHSLIEAGRVFASKARRRMTTACSLPTSCTCRLRIAAYGQRVSRTNSTYSPHIGYETLDDTDC